MPFRRTLPRARAVVPAIGALAVVGVLVLVTAGAIRRPPPGSLPPLPPASVPAAAPTDRYVAPGGDDAAAGTADAPLRTIQAAVDRDAGGGTIRLAAGTYEAFGITGIRPTVPLVIAAADGATATVRAGPSSAAISIDDARNVHLVNLDVAGPDRSMGAAIRIERSDGVTIERSSIRDARGGFGIEARFSAGIDIRGNDVARNAIGIRLFGEGDPTSVHDVVIEGNRIHDADSMVIDDDAPDNDYGGNGIVWHKVSGATIARDNEVWSNRAASHDYGTDGGAFEVWGSSNVEITGNTVWDNVNVMETGTDGPECGHLTYARNVAYGTDRGVGLIIRCASDSVLANNVVDGVEGYAFELSDRRGGNRFAASIEGLTISNNIVTGSTAYAIRNSLPPSVTIDHNLIHRAARLPIATLPGGQAVVTLRAFVRATGFDEDSLEADPRFVDPARRDYRLLTGSPAIDAGTVVLPGQGFLGAAPDLGAYEGGVDLPSPS